MYCFIQFVRRCVCVCVWVNLQKRILCLSDECRTSTEYIRCGSAREHYRELSLCWDWFWVSFTHNLRDCYCYWFTHYRHWKKCVPMWHNIALDIRTVIFSGSTVAHSACVEIPYGKAPKYRYLATVTTDVAGHFIVCRYAIVIVSIWFVQLKRKIKAISN